MQQPKLTDLSTYRRELMGMAAIMIILCHAPAHISNLPSMLNITLPHLAIGVDIFLLLSGLGIYYSLARRKVCLFRWYKTRFLKLGIPYLTFAIPMYSYLALRSHLSVGELILHISTISYWTQGWGLWFVAMLIPVYLTAPFVYKAILSPYAITFVTVMILLALGLANMPCFRHIHPVYKNIVFCYMRYPSFLLGMMSAHIILRDDRHRTIVYLKPLLLTCCIILVALALGVEMTIMSVYWVLMLPIVYILITMLNLIKAKRFVGLNMFMGDISLESYCTNVFLVGIIMNMFPMTCEWLIYTLSSMACALISYALHTVNN